MTSIELAKRIRVHALKMIHGAQAAHIGSCLSCADILAVYYAERGPDSLDRLIVSKGHAAAAVYAALAETGHFPVADLASHCCPGSKLTGCVSHAVPGVVLSTGSLGHGLPVACGMALADRSRRVFVLMSDGELDCGTTWEAALFAAHHNLANLTVIVDVNRWQALGPTRDVLNTHEIERKWEAFGWACTDCSGHDHSVHRRMLESTRNRRPGVIVAYTTKGAGVSFMENDPGAWHYRPPNADELQRALSEVES
jgi:transketolase